MAFSSMPFSIKSPLVPLSVVVAGGLRADQVERLRDTGALRWVFDISPGGKSKAELRYWTPAVAAFLGEGGPRLRELAVADVVAHVVGVDRPRLRRDEVCLRLCCSETTLSRLMRNRLLRAETRGRAECILTESLTKFLTGRVVA